MSSLPVVNETRPVEIEIFKSGPKPLTITYRNAGVLQALPANIAMEVIAADNTTLFTLTVGAGLTLSTAESVANAAATIQLTETQAAQVKDGAFTTYVIRTGVAPNRAVFMRGKLIGVSR